MQRIIWTSIVAGILCGCAGRMNTDLLQARIREQAVQITDSQREIAKTRSELKLARLEVDLLKGELAQVSGIEELSPRQSVQISRLHIFPLASGGLNKDELPGDDTVVVQFAPIDQDNEPAKQPGRLEFTLIDPRLPESERELGTWNYSAEECRNHWTRGIGSSGYQFSLPLDQSPQHPELIVKLHYVSPDDRHLEATQRVKVVTPPSNQVASANPVHLRKRTRVKPIQVVDESGEPLPPVGDADLHSKESDLPDWAQEDSSPIAPRAKRGIVTLHSANWVKDEVPVYR